jgi:hypothetical protein
VRAAIAVATGDRLQPAIPAKSVACEVAGASAARNATLSATRSPHETMPKPAASARRPSSSASASVVGGWPDWIPKVRKADRPPILAERA